MKNNWAWSKKGTPAIVKIPQTRALSHTIIGTICASSVLHVVLIKPPPTIKKSAKNKRTNKGMKGATENDETEEDDVRPGDGEINNNKPAPKGTTAAHYVKFINELLDVMDLDGNMKGYYLVMDNASIHKSQPTVRKIEKRVYVSSTILSRIKPNWTILLVFGKVQVEVSKTFGQRNLVH
jgi:hypothetical protein